MTIFRLVLGLTVQVTVVTCLTPSSYLDSLNHHRDSASSSSSEESGEIDSASKPFGMPAEEYYGHTNPMANNWPGSRHEEFGGYLKGLANNQGSKSSRGSSSLTQDGAASASTSAPDEWYGKSNPMASWKGYRHPKFGGYLDSLQDGADGGSSSV